jgi:hypothetical protein
VVGVRNQSDWGVERKHGGRLVNEGGPLTHGRGNRLSTKGSEGGQCWVWCRREDQRFDGFWYGLRGRLVGCR